MSQNLEQLKGVLGTRREMVKLGGFIQGKVKEMYRGA